MLDRLRQYQLVDYLVHNLYKIHDGFHSIHMLLPASKSFQDFHKIQEEESANNFTTARWSRGWRNVKTSQIAIIKFAFSFNFIIAAAQCDV